MATELTPATRIEFCRKMLLIRHFEEALITLHNEGRFRGHYHVYIGQEATGVPALSLLQAEDYVFTTHRNHGHILARDADPGRMLAEILGRRDGYNKGKGGSFHVAPVELGFLQTSAVVAGILPLATGAAYAAREKQSGQVSVCLFGDGALEEGAVAESFNLASIWKLPVLYLCENNGKYGHGKATGAMRSSTMSVFPLTDLPTAYKIPAQQVDGTDVEAVIDVVGDALKKIRAGEGPQFIEAQTVRWPGSVSNWPVLPIATEVSLAWDLSSVLAAVKDWYQFSDPLLIFIRKLLAEGHASKDQIVQLEKGVKEKIAEAIQFAFASPEPDLQSALEGVFAS
ncbi:MAG: thiamine pyrophosphate-dependent enzyme [Deltaproteobacteria bacterium]|nr:thiamine pyrophosphate-dependent enzyme [Deltaproteobacteria bacterium]